MMNSTARAVPVTGAPLPAKVRAKVSELIAQLGPGCTVEAAERRGGWWGVVGSLNDHRVVDAHVHVLFDEDGSDMAEVAS